MVDWKRVMIDELRNYRLWQNSLDATNERAREIENMMQSPMGGSYDKTPVMGGASTLEDRWLNGIAEVWLLREAHSATEQRVKQIEQALSLLTDEERLVLELFYIDRPSRHIDELRERLCVEKSQVYRIEERALRRFTHAMIGQIET